MFMFCDRLATEEFFPNRDLCKWLISEPDFVSWLNGFVNFVYFPWALQRRLLVLSLSFLFAMQRCTTSAQFVLFSISSELLQPSRDLLPDIICLPSSDPRTVNDHDDRPRPPRRLMASAVAR